MQHEFLNIIKNAAAFFNTVDDRSEVVIGQNQLGGILRNIRSILAHRNTDIGTLQ